MTQRVESLAINGAIAALGLMAAALAAGEALNAYLRHKRPVIDTRSNGGVRA